MQEIRFSAYAEALSPSPIREILQVIKEKPNVISLAGGLPNPKTFPTEEEMFNLLSDIDLKYALQYGTTKGAAYLRDQLVNYLPFDVHSDNILITSGSQQALDLLPKLLANPGDSVIVEEPTYLGALIPFKRAGLHLLGVTLNDDGINLSMLEDLLRKNEVKFIYTIPTFQNPSGITMSNEKRKGLLKLSEEYNVPIIEDDPYGALTYGVEYKPLRAYSKDVIYLGTASKIFSPGIRVAWLIAPENVVEKFELAKQGVDLCTNTLGQYLLAKYIESSKLNEHINMIRDFYRPKRDLMQDLLEEYVSATWVKPGGGMFFWLETNKDTRKIFQEAIDAGVAYVPGDSFFVNPKTNYMRLNFTYVDSDKMETGVKIIGKLLNSN